MHNFIFIEVLSEKLDAKKYEIAEQEYLLMLEELFRQEMEEDDELLRASDDDYAIVEYDK